MSRTYRSRQNCTHDSNAESYIKSNQRFRPFKEGRKVKRKKTQDQIQQETDQYHIEYEKFHSDPTIRRGDDFWFGRHYWKFDKTKNREVRVYAPRYPSKYQYVHTPWTYDDECEELRGQYEAFNRDGKWKDTRKKSFRKHCAKHTRNANKNFCHKVLRGEDIEDDLYPSVYETKKYFWSFW